MVNKVLEGKMEDFIQEESKKPGITNNRNGKLKKRVKSAAGMLEIKTPGDRNGDFQSCHIKEAGTFLNERPSPTALVKQL